MAATSIEWCDFSFNPWSGCTKVSAGCARCYAEVNYSVKMRGVKWGPNGNRIVASEGMWKEPLKWEKKALAAYDEWHATGMDASPPPGRPRVFCASLADVFEDWTGPMLDSKGKQLLRGHMEECLTSHNEPITMDYIRFNLFNLIRRTPNLDWLLLTKRPENIARMTAEFLGAWKLESMPNVWLGTSVENQAAADERIPHLLRTPAAVRFLSCEPLLSAVDLSKWLNNPVVSGHPAWRDVPDRPAVADPMLHWVIVGCESGRGMRPMQLEWAASLRDQCQAAGVKFFLKQMVVGSSVSGEVERFPLPMQIREFPKAVSS